MTNRLIHETSPYLLQHAENPVDWYPWGDEAIAHARTTGRPILLSIGYSACHWCHVMERESFEDVEIARLMNESFVCVKVDREERPDLDEIYMAATLTMNSGQGGWPMTVFLTPELEPFFAGTYFPPRDMYGRPGFPTLLRHLSERWRQDPDSCRLQAARLVEVLREQSGELSQEPVGADAIDAAVEQLRRDFDRRHGGFGHAPKFPPCHALLLLLRHHRRSGSADALEMVRATLDGMARGGIYDQVGGGFARYSTDERWLVPHFEKMLYDNAQLVKVYLEAFQATGHDGYRRIAVETLDYVLREMIGPEGGFHSSTDADSEGEEGKFFVWTPREIRGVLKGDDARRFCAYYDITDGGNWEGKSIPNVPEDIAKVAARLAISEDELAASLARGREMVYEARSRRVAPGLDDKILTAWNGLMIGAFAEGYRVLGDDRYLSAAERAASFIFSTLGDGAGGLLRTYRAGKAHIPAFLEDHAYLAEGLLDLYEAGGDGRWLEVAHQTAGAMQRLFQGDDGAFFNAPEGRPDLIVRSREGHDGATPSPNAVAASVLARLSHHLDRPELRHAAVAAIGAYGKAIARHPRAFCRSLVGVDFLLDGPTELAIVGPAAGRASLERELARHYLPNRIVAHHDPAHDGDTDHPLLLDRTTIDGRATLHVCRAFTCQRPTTEPREIEAALAAATPARRPSTIGSRLTGRATAAATSAYATRHDLPAAAFRPLYPDGPLVSTLGFGGYRIHVDDPTHRQALGHALRSGCNLIDTSTNYGDGGSERAVGRVLSELARSGGPTRAQVVVVSKIGYVQGRNLEIARRRATEGTAFPEMVTYAEDCWHCIHPDWLSDQLERSLDRLGLETLDVCLLHNPEYFLAEARRNGGRRLDTLRAELSDRLARAFAFLETQVASGSIGCYGVSSNNLGLDGADPEAMSMSALLAAARDGAGPDHHLRVVQLPLNLLETGPLTMRGGGADGKRTALEEARAAGLSVLVNRPLNANLGGTMWRLADQLPASSGADDARSDPAAGLAVLVALEEEFARALAPAISVPPGATSPDRYFRFGDELTSMEDRIEGLPHWQQIEGQFVRPQVGHVVSVLDRHLAGAPAWRQWRDRYLPALDDALAALRSRAARSSQERSDRISGLIDPLLPDHAGESLSRKALWVLASTPGVTAVLVGMRSDAYVDDSIAVLSWPALSNVTPVYAAAARLADSHPGG